LQKTNHRSTRQKTLHPPPQKHQFVIVNPTEYNYNATTLLEDNKVELVEQTSKDASHKPESNLSDGYNFTSILVLAMALLFVAFFQISKHNPLLGKINPFFNDPYDAAGSLATLLAIVAASMSMYKASRLRTAAGTAFEQKRLSLVRIQMTSVLAVGVTIFCDAVGMIRHFSLWRGTNGGTVLVLLVSFIAFACVLTSLLVLRTGQVKPDHSRRTWAAIAGLVVLAPLALISYMGSLRDGSTAGALGAIADGDIVLLVLMRYIVMALVPHHTYPQG
jgi:hypothetical protein